MSNATKTKSKAGENSAIRDPDVRLMLRVKGGDEAAFTELVANYQSRLVSIFYNMLGNRETAEDLAQECFLRIYQARNGYEPTAKFSTWLYRIANNLASNSRRSFSRRKEVSLSANNSGSMESTPREQMVPDKSALMPTRQADSRESCDVVRSALSTLGERQRLAVLLHKFEEMSYADIGEAMDLSPAAVKSLLSRARDNLRESLTAHVRPIS
ncbi:ECF RNA polymerase sigma factor SigW [Symmachiella macrocystis]|uniref:ECF RNA polymerase sigma factor SigW n=1 Tax=Symmachiella macrocystis TaxID=2527985 RepID=A0A5C6BKL5_9PLAN|nr:sigma-70 family RNA polymerase sigma factor [Symmachiella macrocystis]TWU12187.1 ECF RNA polymerase sigma factor SigW [Symmachiella macrocystis]